MKSEDRDIFLVKVDVTNSGEVSAAVDSISEHFGRPISVLINNAGCVGQFASVDEMDESLWDEVVSINLKGAFLCTKYCVPGMRGSWRRQDHKHDHNLGAVRSRGNTLPGKQSGC